MGEYPEKPRKCSVRERALNIHQAPRLRNHLRVVSFKNFSGSFLSSLLQKQQLAGGGGNEGDRSCLPSLLLLGQAAPATDPAVGERSLVFK